MSKLADLKRVIHTGLEIHLVRIEERTFNAQKRLHDGEFHDMPIAEKLRGARYVSYVDTTGFYLKQGHDKGTKGSFCAWPKASELEYVGMEFVITEYSKEGEAYQRRHYKILT